MALLGTLYLMDDSFPSRDDALSLGVKAYLAESRGDIDLETALACLRGAVSFYEAACEIGETGEPRVVPGDMVFAVWRKLSNQDGNHPLDVDIPDVLNDFGDIPRAFITHIAQVYLAEIRAMQSHMRALAGV